MHITLQALKFYKYPDELVHILPPCLEALNMSNNHNYVVYINMYDVWDEQTRPQEDAPEILAGRMVTLVQMSPHWLN